MHATIGRRGARDEFPSHSNPTGCRDAATAGRARTPHRIDRTETHTQTDCLSETGKRPLGDGRQAKALWTLRETERVREGGREREGKQEGRRARGGERDDDVVWAR